MRDLASGSLLGPYEIVSPIGRGGMGEVYRARDTRLGRDVAIKISAERFSERFEREARAIAALNHPNICTLHDVGPDYLVMELVEGETLAARIAQGPIPLADCLRYARQIADALSEAHEKGVVHRDLKPGNVIITPNDSVKVLDFGLAKVGPTPTSDAPPAAEDSPTLLMAATQAGVILGTASYMSPEQARGKAVDKRADIWALGVVLYEMLTGTRPFKGEDMTDTLASVVKEQPDLGAVPPQVRRLLERCLEKDPRKRLRDASGVALLLEEPGPLLQFPATSRKSTFRWRWPSAVALMAMAAAVALWAPWRTSPTPDVVRFEVPPPENGVITGVPPALSPDGRHLAFVVQGSGLWVRSLDTLEARVLPGTQDATGATFFWSPDSRSIGYQVAPPMAKLKRVELAGGPPQALCDTPGPTSAAWSPAGVIVYGLADGLHRVPEAGGECTALTTTDTSRGELGHRFPSFLPDGKRFVYFRASSKPEAQGIYRGSLDNDPSQQDLTRLLATDSRVVYAPLPGSKAGHLLFMREGSLVAQAFDPDRAAFTGEAVLVAENVSAGNTIVGGYFSASATGALAYRTGARGASLRLTVLDRLGNSVVAVGDLAQVGEPSFSPDGTQVAFSRAEEGGGPRDIWLYDFVRRTPTRFTFDPAHDGSPVWSADGTRIAFGSERRGGARNLYRKLANNAGTEDLLLESNQFKTPTDWSRDGRFLLFTARDLNGIFNQDIWYLPFTAPAGAPAEPVPYLRTEFNEGNATLSPDGRFVAYVSDEAGRNGIHVRTFPDPSGGQWTISTDGGNLPRWRRDGRVLYFVSNQRMMSVDVTLTPTFRAGVPRELFAMPSGPNGFDVDAKGERFVKAVDESAAKGATPTPITIVLNWAAALRREK